MGMNLEVIYGTLEQWRAIEKPRWNGKVSSDIALYL
jgi:hypothetical protein